MQKLNHKGQEIRHFRSKRHITEGNEPPQKIGSRDNLAVSWVLKQNREIMRDERRRDVVPSPSSRLPRDDNVQRWLEQTTQEAEVISHSGFDSPRENASRELDFEWSPQDKEYGSNNKNLKERGNSRKRKFELSSDSSFLEYALAPASRCEILDGHNVAKRIEGYEVLETDHELLELESSVGPEGSLVSLSIDTRDKSFEKRKRHKTNLDRYEPKMALIGPKSLVNKKQKNVKQRKSQSRRKLNVITADHLMHRFASKSVGLDRLTIRPSLTAGLFKNGRASSPARRRGLPDLAFSEMDFLRRSKQRAAEPEHEKPSKWREKERRRSERVLNEISQYFKPTPELYSEAEKTDIQETHHVPKLNYKSRRLGAESRNSLTRISSSNKQSIDSSTELSLAQDRSHTFEKLASKPFLDEQTVKPSQAPDTIMIVSTGDGTNNSMSDSENSPVVSQRNRENYSVASVTPELVRKLLDDTGIFQHTGIERCALGKSNAAYKELSQISNYDSSSMSMREPSCANITNQAPIKEWESVPINHSGPRALQLGFPCGNKNVIMDNEETLYAANPNVQQCRLIIGENESNDEKGKMLHSYLSNTKTSQQGLSREEIAQKSYVKKSAITSTAEHGAASIKNLLFLAAAPKENTSLSYKQPIEEAASREPRADTCHLLNSGFEEPQEGCNSSRNDRANSSGGSVKNQLSKMPSLDNLTTMNLKGTVQVTDAAQVPCHTPEVIIDIPVNYPSAESSKDQIKLIDNQQDPCESQYKSVSWGLPMRGIRPGQDDRSIPFHPSSNLPTGTESLYNRQIRNDMALGMGDHSYDYCILQEQLLHQYDTPVYMQKDDNRAHETLDFDHEYFFDTANLQEDRQMLIDDIDSMEHEILQDEKQSLWVDQDISLSNTARNDHCNDSRAADSFNQRYLPTPERHPYWEWNHFHTSEDSVKHLTEGEDFGESHELKGFWQPRRQY